MQASMSAPHQGFLPTRHSLLHRLKDLGDDVSWKEFFDLYWKLIYAVALKSGLRAPEAEDVVQETVLSVAKTINQYEYDPTVTFKGWLHLLVKRRVADHFRRQARNEPLADDLVREETIEGSVVERTADPAGAVLDAVWEEEWQKNLIEAALEKLKTQIKVKQYQVFYLNAVKGKSPSEVARCLNVNVAYVHLTRHRVQPLFKRAVEQVEKNKRE
jgi:RNA polymerase sigma factor (sigma-70 family)